MTRTLAALALAAGLGVALAPAAADDKRTGDDQPKTAGKALPDQEFVRQAASSGVFEVRSSQDAVRKAMAAGVKMFAQRMIEDHTRANQELTALAARKGLTVPPGLDRKHFDLLARLGQLTGTDYDAEFMK